MSMLDSFFNRGFKGAKCKTLLKLTIPRIKLLRNRREIQIKQMRRDISKLLETGQEATARIRVEHIIREENMMAAQEVIELFCELIAVRLPIIETQRECPLDLKEAISSVCFAAPRCADLPELLQVQMLFGMKYGKEFISAATELMPDCGVNRQLIELLSVRAPSPEKKLKLLKEIAEEHELDWDPAASETELLKSHEDLLNGPTKFVSGATLPFPEEKYEETLHSPPDQVYEEQPYSDTSFEGLDFPEVPTNVLPRPSMNVASAPDMVPFNPASPHPGIYHESSQLSVKHENMSEPHVKPQQVMQERPVTDYDKTPNISVGEDKQFLPFISPPSSSPAAFYPTQTSLPPSASFSVRQSSPPPSPPFSGRQNSLPQPLSRTRSDAIGDIQDVVAAAQAAAETAERAAAAARSAASLAQARIAEITKNNIDDVLDNSCENPFSTDIPHQSAAAEKTHVHQDSNDSFSMLHSPNYDEHRGSECSNICQLDKLDLEFDPSSPNELVFDHEPARHQPQRLPSMDDDPYYSYPNLFTSQNSNLGSRGHSFTDKSGSNHDH